jgi:hypothetical protein
MSQVEKQYSIRNVSTGAIATATEESLGQYINVTPDIRKLKRKYTAVVGDLRITRTS